MKVKPCPFCKGPAGPHPNFEYAKDYLVIYHDPDCWLLEDGAEAPLNFTLLPVNKINTWNRRAH